MRNSSVDRTPRLNVENKISVVHLLNHMILAPKGSLSTSEGIFEIYPRPAEISTSLIFQCITSPEPAAFGPRLTASVSRSKNPKQKK